MGSGSHPVTLRVADGAGNVSSCTTTFTVADSKPPVVNCPPSVSVRAEQNCQAAVPDLLARVRVLDNCTPADQLVKTQNPPAGTLVGLGTHPITVTVTDVAGNTTACAVRLKVIDSTAPVVQSVVANPNVILQTNKQMVPVTVSVSASDNCDSNPVSRIISITSSDPVKGPGDNTRPDWQITGPLTASVRAERSPTGGDRTYTITVRCSDSAGNHSTKSVTVIVQKPHNP